ncbi:DUF4186 family protein [Kribbella sindirgiensis]|uniref:DUF4186 family protein n=1 Tax=Kribbella sindirgiensis TaxID=1124744 RepID=A0A4V2M5D8_9ACTN|nr:DUF4186 family protein [Kribbella sindirgiensis]TCC39362.1 DUF4186 family protein [Kribbella sindirgiensis]
MREFERSKLNDRYWTEVDHGDETLPLPAVTLPPLPPKWSAEKADAARSGIWKQHEEIEIKCTTTICDADLHCFKLTKKLTKQLVPGACRDCGVPLVSLARTAERDLSDIDSTFAAMQLECIRHYFWHVPFGERALNYALRAGRDQLMERVEPRIRSGIGRAEHPREGRQTPVAPDKATALDYAMHAVAACCRKCAEYWHGIPTGRPLTDDEVTYLETLAKRYLEVRLPDLPAGPTKVPRRRIGDNVHLLAPASRTNRADQIHRGQAS